MILQILPPDKGGLSQSIFENQLVFVLLGLAIGVYVILKIAKYLSTIKVVKGAKETVHTS